MVPKKFRFLGEYADLTQLVNTNTLWNAFHAVPYCGDYRVIFGSPPFVIICQFR
jgi:hypothetical protein